MTRRLAIILWPAFLMAAVLEMLVFAVIDPGQLHGPSGQPLPLSNLAVYSVSFFIFWAVTATGCAITAFLAEPGAQ
jgi:hypothetical protein